jgi:predicted ATPase/DNA-binding SARP family transcriptional activator
VLEFRVLGPLEIGGPEGPVDVRGRKERAVLAALLVDPGRARPAEELVATVWGEDAPPSAEKSLQVRLSHLRAALPGGRDVLVRDGPGYRLRIDADAVDAHRFERLVEEAGRAAGDPVAALDRFEEALALVRGRPYADVEDFTGLASEVRRLDELRLRAVEGRMRALLDLGRHGDALPELERLVRDEPHHEALAGLLMLALYRAGRQVEALRAYREAAARLRDLGLEPSEELRRIEGLILTQSEEVAAPAAPPPPAAADAPRTNLRARLTSFVGREAELERLRTRIRDERLVTLVGPGGVGKTSLATEAARQLVHELRDGVFVVGLATLTGPDQIPAVIADALPFGAAGPNLRGGDGHEAIDALGERLAGREVLLVLDDCEHVAAGVARVAERLLGAAGGVRVLATSRQALGAQGESIVDLRPFDPGGEEALRLFVERARAVQPSFALDDTTREAALTICRRLDGLPLALELAAARVRALPVQEIAARLDDRFALLGDARAGAGPGERRSLGQVVDWSFGLLPEREQELFCRLAVFRSPFTLEAAERVAGGGPVDRGEVADLLVSLVERSMLSTEDGRYRMLETLRAFGLRRLAEHDALDGALRRHAGWAATLADTHGRRVYAEGIDAVRAALAPNRADLDAAVDLALDEGDGERAVPLATALGILDFGLGDSTRARTRLARALRLEASAQVRVPALTVQSLLLTMHGLVDAGTAASERALEEATDARRRDRALATRGTARLLGGDMTGALEDFEGLEERFRLRGETWIRGLTCGWQAYVRLVLGELAEAQRLSRRAVQAFERCGDVWGLLSASVNLARVAVALGAYDDAAQVLERAVQAGEARVPERLGPLLHEYGLVEMRRERYDEAERLWRRCAELGERQAMSGGWVLLTGPAERWYAVMAAGHLARTAGDWDTASARYGEAVALLEAVEREDRDTIGINAAIANSLVCRGEVTDPAEAIGHLRRALARAMASGDRRLVARVMEAMAQVGDDPVQGAELLGAADAVRLAAGGPRPPIERRAVQAIELALRTAIGDEAFDAAAERGRADPLAIAYAAR